MLLKQTAIAASFAVLLIGCATTVETLSSDAVSSDAYNKIMAAQGHDHYCASGVCDTAPALLSARAPAYPAHALAAGKSGQASVIFDIDARGIPENISLESATAPEFGEASLEAVKSWRYKPATLDSRAVKYERVRQTFPFQPRG